MTRLKSAVASVSKNKLIQARVLDIIGDRCSVQLVNNGRKLFGVPFVGGPMSAGKIVYIDYSSGQPVAQARGEEPTPATTERARSTQVITEFPQSQIGGPNGDGSTGGTPITVSGMENPLTTLGDMIYGETGTIPSGNKAVYESGARGYANDCEPTFWNCSPDHVLQSHETYDMWANSGWSPVWPGCMLSESYEDCPIWFDLGVSQLIATVRLKTRPDWFNPGESAWCFAIPQIRVFYGSDGVNWTDLGVHDTGQDGLYGDDTFFDLSTPTAARWWKFQVETARCAPPSNYIRIYHIGLFESVEGIAPTRLPIGAEGQVLTVVAEGLELRPEWAAPTGGAEDFIELGDVPITYVDAAGKLVAVNATEDALEFIDTPSTDKAFTELTDAPASYVDQAAKLVRVNATEDGLEFVAAAAGGVDDFLDLTDTPAAYTGAAGKVVAVNSEGDSLEFVDAPTGAVAMADLTDVDLTGIADEDILQYDSGTGTWLPVTPPTGGDPGTGNILYLFNNFI